MKPTCDEIKAMMGEVGKTVFVTKRYDVGHLKHYDLSNGWQIEVFDEGSGEWDYLETVRPPGEELTNLYDDEHGDFYDEITCRWDPTAECLDELLLT